ncbi:MAG: DNA polymerase III subunit chi [Rhodospirillales bacterium]|jgi:DNA polymerase-3 subunit chi|nr:DNA polymerase III subunit chi [Rhodospirillales bacterium]
MAKIGFYQLLTLPLEKALPRLLEKTLAEGKRAVVIAASAERVEALNQALWTFGRDSWLPHGAEKDGFAEDQPIWLTERDENPNAASFLFLTDGSVTEYAGDYQRVFEIFDGNDPGAVEAARERWRSYRGSDHALTYWQQTGTGGWENREQA